MKKLVVLAFFVLSLTACADEKKVITFATLPQAAKATMTQFVNTEDILLVTQEGSNRWAEYEVKMTDQSDWEFDAQGTLKNVEMKSGIPDALLPEIVLSQIHASYPNAYVVEYNIDKRDQEVKLNNGIELTFDLKGKLLKTEVD